MLFACAVVTACNHSDDVQLSPPAKPAPIAFAAPVAPVSGSVAGFAPSTIVPRTRPITSRSRAPWTDAQRALDDNPDTGWSAGRPTPTDPAWLAIDVGRAPARLLVVWSAAGSFNYEETDFGSPGAYRIETSADSTDGQGGTWTSVAEVAQVETHGGMNAIPFVGQRWVRFVVTSAPAVSPNGVQLDELALYDISAGASDTWFFLGDSIGALSFGRLAKNPDRFASLVHASHPKYFPAVVNGGTGGVTSGDVIARLGAWIDRTPAHFWAIGIGTNDAAGNATDTSRFRSNLVTIVRRLREAGRVPIVATIPFSNDGQHEHVPDFNRVIDQVCGELDVRRGPDLYAWFAGHPEELRDGIHPNERGIVSINRLWAKSVDGLYGR